MATFQPGKYEDDEIRKTLIIPELLHALNRYDISQHLHYFVSI